MESKALFISLTLLFMRTMAITTVLLILISIAGNAWLNHSPQGKKFKAPNFNKKENNFTAPDKAALKLSSKAKEAKKFAISKQYNGDYCFLIDMSLPSNQKRFFVYDLKKDTVSKSGLVTHGRCNLQWLEGRKYSNEVGCGCTSLGKYKIGYSYYGRFGLAFKLHGLDKSNNNAFKRYVVLHSHECVPEYEVANDICQSDGCPTVSPQFLKQLDPMIKTSKKPVLLWIYE